MLCCRFYCRFYCYPCDYNLCGGCIEQAAKERSQQEQLVSCLASLCEKVLLPNTAAAIFLPIYCYCYLPTLPIYCHFPSYSGIL